jgi:hypothetical protein
MQVREAKDFLVRETAEQARIEGVPLSELEKRMMYFVENEEMSEDPIALNEEFETEYDTDEYEAKIHGLLHRAYARVKKENPATARQWKEAIGELSKGDHYLPVLWGEGILAANYPVERPPYDSLKLFGTAIAVVCAMFAFAALSDRIARRFPNFPIPGVLARRLILYSVVASYFVFRHLRRRKRRGQKSAVERLS